MGGWVTVSSLTVVQYAFTKEEGVEEGIAVQFRGAYDTERSHRVHSRDERAKAESFHRIMPIDWNSTHLYWGGRWVGWWVV